MLMNSQNTIWYSWNKITLYNIKITYEWNGKLLLALKCIVSNLYPFLARCESVDFSKVSSIFYFYFWNDWFFFSGVSKFGSMMFTSFFDGLPLERLMFYRWLFLHNYCHNMCDTLAHFALFHTYTRKSHSSFKFSTHCIVFLFFFRRMNSTATQLRHKTLYSWCETHTDFAIVSAQRFQTTEFMHNFFIFLLFCDIIKFMCVCYVQSSFKPIIDI